MKRVSLLLSLLWLGSGMQAMDGGKLKQSLGERYTPRALNQLSYSASVTSGNPAESVEVYDLSFGADVAIDGLQKAGDPAVRVKLPFESVVKMEVVRKDGQLMIMQDYNDEKSTRFKVVVTYKNEQSEELFFPMEVSISGVRKGNDSATGRTWMLKDVTSISSIRPDSNVNPMEAERLAHHEQDASWWTSVKRWYS